MHSKALLCFLFLSSTLINAAPADLAYGRCRINHFYQFLEFWRNLEWNLSRMIYGTSHALDRLDPVYEETVAEFPTPENVNKPPQSIPNSDRSENDISAQPYKEKEWEKAKECPICLEEFNDTDSKKVIPTCRHVFHKECIDEWIETKVKENNQFPVCPVCKVKLPNKMVEEVKKEHGLVQPPVQSNPFFTSFRRRNSDNAYRSPFSSFGQWNSGYPYSNNNNIPYGY